MRVLLLGLVHSSRTARADTLQAVDELFERGAPVALVPYAAPREAWATAGERFSTAIDREVVNLHHTDDPIAALADAPAIAIAGGNAWCLAHHLRRLGVVPVIRKRVGEGVPFLGWGAGAVMASPTIVTTSDHPTCETIGTEGLHLVPFHVASLPSPCDRAGEHHCPACGDAEARLVDLSVGEKERWIVGLTPEAGILVQDRHVAVVGRDPVRLFRSGRARQHLGRGNQARFLLEEADDSERRRDARHHSHRCGRSS